MIKLRLVLVMLVLLVFVHCNDECECPSGPIFSDLKIKLTINDENPEVEVVIFNGRIESRDTIVIDTVNAKEVIYTLESGQYYAATARYLQGSKTIVAINGKEMNFGQDDCGCDTPQDFSLNLKLAD